MASVSALRFAKFPIKNQVFYVSPLSAGLVNLKPLVPGHVLVIPRRVTQRFSDLTPEEVSDLFGSVQEIGKVVEKVYGASSLTIAIQDGPLAGQTVPHLHVHILPRKAGDFDPLDKVYDALDASDSSQALLTEEELAARNSKAGIEADENRKARGRDEMKGEAMQLAALMPKARQPEFIEW